MAQVPSPSQTTNLRTSNDYGQFYRDPYEDPWAPSSLLRNPNNRKNKATPRPGRTNEDYGEFYQDPALRTNIKNFLGGSWQQAGVGGEGYVPSPRGMNPDWEQERQVLRQQPGYIPPVMDGHAPRMDPRRSAYDGPARNATHARPPLNGALQFSGPIRTSPTLQHPLRSSLDDQRAGAQGGGNVSPRWDFKVDPWKSEYRRHYLPDANPRNAELRRLDHMTQRRSDGAGGFAYVEPLQTQPQGYQPSAGPPLPYSQ